MLPPNTPGPPSAPVPSPTAGPTTPNGSVMHTLAANAAGFGAMGAANAGVAAINSAAGFGTTEASVVAIVQTFTAQLVKHFPHFDEQRWLEPFMVVLGAPVAWVGFYAHLDPVQAAFKTVVTAIQGAGIAKVQYHAAQPTVIAGALKPVAAENEYAQNPHPWPAPGSPGWGMTGPTPPTGATP